MKLLNICQTFLDRIYGHLVSTHEAGFLRSYVHGRTDSIRASSMESLDFCKAMLDPMATVSCDR